MTLPDAVLLYLLLLCAACVAVGAAIVLSLVLYVLWPRRGLR